MNENDTTPNTPTEQPLRSDRAIVLPSWVGPVIGLVLLSAMIGLGGLYLWGSMLAPEDLATPLPPRVNDEPETVRARADVQVTEVVSPSTEIDAIRADIESTRIDTADTDIQAMDAEIESFITNIESTN